MAFDPNKPYELVSGGFDPTQSFTLVEEPTSSFDLSKPYTISDEEGPGAIDYAAAFGSDIAISEAGRLGGAAVGTAFLPGIGTAIGYVIGGMGAGAAGSIARQRILNPDGELSYGQIVADAFINLIPGAKAGKFGASAVARQAAAGAGISAGARVAETAIDEGELPTFEELASAGLTGAALGAGLGVSGEVFSNAYSKFAGMPTRRLSEAFKIGDPDAKILVDGVERTGKEYGEMLPKTFNDIKLGISEAYSDDLIRARVLQDEVAAGQIKDAGQLKVKSDESDFYLQRRLAEGKISAKNEELERLVDIDGAFLSSKANDLESEASILSRSVNDYLYAKHGVAYNKANQSKFGGDGAAGRTTKEFQETVKDFEARGLDKELGESIELRKDLSKRILNTIEEGGLISKGDANKLRKQFPNYVPLNRILETDELADVASTVTGRAGRYETLSSGIRRAKGSDLEVNDISQNIVDNLIGATRRAQVNKANQAFVKLIRDNPATAGDIAVVRKPKVVSTKLVKDTSETANALRAQGKKVSPKKVPIYENADKNVLTVFENGKPLFVEFKDPRLAAAMKGTNREVATGIIKAVQPITRFLGGLYTRFNPEFMVPNLIRDRSEALVNNAQKMSMGQAFKTLDPISTVRDDMATITRNITGQRASGGRAAEMDKLYDEFVESGARTGGLGLSTLNDIEKSIAELGKKLNAPTKSKAKQFNKFVNGVNEVFENSTRFATYRRGRADGMTMDQAALAARNSSFDPQLQGAQGDSLRALYMFSNPAIQGAKNFLRSMNPVKNPRLAASVMGALTATTYTLDRYNKTIDENYREKIPEFKLNKHLTIVQGTKPDGSLDYISIPIGYSMVPFKIASDYLQRIMFGDEENIDASAVAKDMSRNIIDSYNPMGGSPIPTVLKPMFELSRNKDGLGRDIRPSWLENENISDVEKIHPWTARTQGGELALNLAEQIQDMGYEVSPETLLFLYRNYTGGPGETVKRLFNVTSKMMNGEKISRADIPVARRFFGETYAKTFELRTGDQQLIENIDKQENTSRAKASRIASGYKTKIQNADSPQEQSRILQDMLVDPEANEAVTRRVETFLKDQAAGITAADKRVKSLSVAGRAQYFMDRIKDMDNEEAARYLQEQINRRVLTPRVEEAMMGMQAFQSAFGQ
tara:strand:+ start:3932 stop:7420 length:3489 start_codon:yes stop_codon:yes gene_type:complete